jgi:penicillin-binding protein 2
MKKKLTRLSAFAFIILSIFAVLVLRLAYIQIVNGDIYKSTAEAKGEKQIPELAPRGEILDRNNRKLATDLQSFNVTYTNSNEKRDNNIINDEIMKCIRIIVDNGDVEKLNIQKFPIIVENNIFSFNFTAKTEALRIKMANNIVKNYSLKIPLLELVKDKKKTVAQNNAINEKNLTKRAKELFYLFANKFYLTKAKMEKIATTTAKKNVEKTNNNTVVAIDYNVRKDMSLVELQKLIAVRVAIQDTGFSQYRSIYIANNVKRETALAILAKSSELQDITSEVAPMRYYPNGEVGSAFLGYLGKIDETESEKFNNLGYDISRELVGKMGLEKVLENNKDMNIKLRGEPGFKYVNVDKFGRVLKQIASLDSIPGDTVVTTIDLKLQKALENSLDKTMKDIQAGINTDKKYPNANRSAGIVINVKTGEVLAIASRPGFDPNWFSATGSISNEVGKILFPTEDDPFDIVPKRMFNYATMGTGPPGSTFKPFVAISALQENAITANTKVVDKGIYLLGGVKAGACWIWNDYHRTHGVVDVVKGLEVSCSSFFYEAGRKLGHTKLMDWAWKFGLGSNPSTGEKPSTGIEIDEKLGEVSSPYRYKNTNIRLTMYNDIIIPLKKPFYGEYTIIKDTEEYKTIKDMFMSGEYNENKLQKIGIMNTNALRHIKNSIRDFDTKATSVGQLLNTSIGQGETLLTPIQMVNYLATLVNGGTRYNLHLVKKILNADGTVKQEIQPTYIDKIKLSKANVNTVKEGMRKVTEEGGTASSAFRNYAIPTGGKTGSASVSPGQLRHGRNAYGWYIGFAPFDNPEIAIAVVIYDAGHGGSAAPVARAVYDQYFGLNDKVPKKSTTNQAINNNIH